jgi:hypothetical protein
MTSMSALLFRVGLHLDPDLSEHELVAVGGGHQMDLSTVGVDRGRAGTTSRRQPGQPRRPGRRGDRGAAGGRGGRQDCAPRSATCCAGWASAARAAAHSRRRWPYPALVLLVSPVMVAVSGTAIHLRPNRPWLLIGVLAFHGLAEELVSRGYAFRGGARRDRHLQARRHPDSRAADLLAADHRRQPHHPATGPRPSATGPDAGTDTGSTP